MAFASGVPFLIYAVLKVVLGYLLLVRVILSRNGRFRGTPGRAILFLTCMESLLNDIRLFTGSVISESKADTESFKNFFFVLQAFHLLLIPLLTVQLGVFISVPPEDIPVKVTLKGCCVVRQEARTEMEQGLLNQDMELVGYEIHEDDFGSSEERNPTRGNKNKLSIFGYSIPEPSFVNFDIWISEHANTFWAATMVLAAFFWACGLMAFVRKTKHKRLSKHHGVWYWHSNHIGSNQLNAWQEIGESAEYAIGLFGCLVSLFLWKRYEYWLLFALMSMIVIGAVVPLRFDHTVYFFLQPFIEFAFLVAFYQTDRDLFGDMSYLNVDVNMGDISMPMG